MKILVLNSGSSSQKASLYEVGETLPIQTPPCLWEGRIEWGKDSARISVKGSAGAALREELRGSRERLVRYLLDTMTAGSSAAISSLTEIDVVGHRVVHGGPHFEDPAIVTPEVRRAVGDVSMLAPLHIQAELEGMDIVESLLGRIPQVAVFDTGFHRQMPLYTQTYPGPYEWFHNGIRRYGFHGINHEYCAGRAAQMLGKDLDELKLVTCHLGNGCSVTAIREGRSIDTTMGFTPLDGLMMGTRSGSVDPGILIHLMRQNKLDGEQIDRVLNHESGLLGISGASSDMRDILSEMKSGHERAKLAFEMFVHRLRTSIGGMAAALGGLDVLVFTAGVGENSPEVRAAVCGGFEFLGLKLDRQANRQTILDRNIAAADSRVRILVIRAEEDWAIAAKCWKLVGATVRTEIAV